MLPHSRRCRDVACIANVWLDELPGAKTAAQIGSAIRRSLTYELIAAVAQLPEPIIGGFTPARERRIGVPARRVARRKLHV